jgi:hypothetical protein
MSIKSMIPTSIKDVVSPLPTVYTPWRNGLMGLEPTFCGS